MRLVTVHITEFQSIQDSSEFEIDDITCLVGKNESGKTALLKALYRLNPVEQVDHEFDDIDDYPRGKVAEYMAGVESGRREPANAVRATFRLEPDDIAAVEEIFGPDCIMDESPSITLSKGYKNEVEIEGLDTEFDLVYLNLLSNSELSGEVISKVLETSNINEAIIYLISLTERGHVNMCVNVIRRQPSLVSVQRRFRPCRRHPGRRPSSVPAPSASGTCSPPPAASSRSQLSPCPPS